MYTKTGEAIGEGALVLRICTVATVKSIISTGSQASTSLRNWALVMRIREGDSAEAVEKI
jgi:hypothetical protein